jgi:hypothetical protein
MAMIAAPAALAAAAAFVFQHRVATSATFAQFKHDFDTQPLAQAALGRAVLVAIGVSAAATVWAVRLLRQPRTKIDGAKRWR